MSEPSAGCVQPAAGILETEGEMASPADSHAEPKEERMTTLVGQPAPDFEATALHNGEFKNIKLSDYLGKWVVLCFYPGDFTFV